MRFPAKFSDTVLDEARKVLDEIQPPDSFWKILDPYAGTGRVHELMVTRPGEHRRMTFGVDCEQPCADAHIHNRLGDATSLPEEWRDLFDCVFTSPTYANRMADTFKPKDTSRRHTYIGAFREATGNPDYTLHENSTCGLGWVGKNGDRYRTISRVSLNEMYRVLKPRGWLLLNMSDHIRNYERQLVCDWWVRTARECGFELIESRPVRTPRMRQGENNGLRVPVEMLFVMRKVA